jgi:hypothetical protein
MPGQTNTYPHRLLTHVSFYMLMMPTLYSDAVELLAVVPMKPLLQWHRMHG